MVISAVLPPRTGWGFDFGTTSSSTQPAPVCSPAGIDVDSSLRNNKRKCEDDLESEQEDQDRVEHTPRKQIVSSDMESFNSSFQTQLSTTPRLRTMATPPSISKRPRFHSVSGRQLPIGRVVESLDRKGLQNLIEAICKSHPYLVSELTGLAPKVTVTTSVENLKNHLNAVYMALPYKGDQRGDYAYLRVRPYVEEFLSALSDYTVNFLPPHESQPSNSLEFLDLATDLLNQLPEWTSPLNNHHRNIAYQDISGAWTLAIKEAIKRGNGLGLAHGNWEAKLSKHNSNCGDKLTDALNCIRDELSWLH